MWCAAHQLDVVAQAFILGVLKEPFRDSLIAVIAYICCQNPFLSEISTKSPKISATSWLSMESLVHWFVGSFATGSEL